jgi:hypothetical protein
VGAPDHRGLDNGARKTRKEECVDEGRAVAHMTTGPNCSLIFV